MYTWDIWHRERDAQNINSVVSYFDGWGRILIDYAHDDVDDDDNDKEKLYKSI